MSLPNVPHYEEDGRVNYRPLNARLSATAYGLALDHVVIITCVDIVMTHAGQILLARSHCP
jgi:hypothetical protein